VTSLKKLVLALMIIVKIFSCSSFASLAEEITGKVAEDIDTVYYLKGDNSKLQIADETTPNVKFSPESEQNGFQNIDIVVQGSKGDKFTLVFGVTWDEESDAEYILAGVPKDNPYVEWIPISSIIYRHIKEYGDFMSDSRGVSVITRNKGVRTLVKHLTMREAAGVIIEFNSIGKDDVYSVFEVELTDIYNISLNLRVLCHNIHEEDKMNLIFDTGINEKTGYHEVNDEPFSNGKVINDITLNAMYDRGDKYLIRMDNGLDIYINNLSPISADKSELILNTSINADQKLIDKYSKATGSSVITLDIESGFIFDDVTYALDLNHKEVTKHMSASEKNIWTDSKKVYCYLVEKSDPEIYFHLFATGNTNENILNYSISGNLLPAEIKSKILYVSTSHSTFNAEKYTMLFTLKELDIDESLSENLSPGDNKFLVLLSFIAAVSLLAIKIVGVRSKD